MSTTSQGRAEKTPKSPDPPLPWEVVDNRTLHPQAAKKLGSWCAEAPITEVMDVDLLLEANGGVIAAHDHKPLRRTLSRLVAAGKLTRVLRGIYVKATDVATLITAVATAYPDAIFTGRTAAWLNGWTDVAPERITAIHQGRSLRRGRIHLTHGRLDEGVWQERRGIRVMTPAMTAIDLIPQIGAVLVDRFLRGRDRLHDGNGLEQLRRALHLSPGRVGNGARRRVLDRSRHNAWSEAEREMHDLLDSACIRGWLANDTVIEDGRRLHPDIVFRALRIIIEVDGYEFHSSREAFEKDRERQNILVANGWSVYRFTWRMIVDQPQQVLGMIRRALRQASRT